MQPPILPTDVESFLALLIASPLVLGTLVAFGLDQLFRWWEGFHAPIAGHDKGLIAALVPPLLADLAYALYTVLGYAPFTWPGLAQATYVGFMAVVGGQWVLQGYRKATSPHPPPAAPPPGTIESGTA